ncbi:hypothetical protein [Spirosoma montaniterrae]|uniref:Uncharacterized protein n=1 Tax=Spirosoma montaniterrae TaxID=1178516 RepID=A0A1P9WXA1_9BACT|nr:hypothetical protein [Spirosoma montaniterrae]AQG79948.1 hypothetical protein AWR27_11800 [Spirosoma montaniterrae]
MKPFLFLISVSIAGLSGGVYAQSNQAPAMQQSTSTETSRPATQPRPELQKTTPKQRQRMETGLDTTLPKNRPSQPNRNRKQRRLRPDSLRRGGATRLDTVR